MSSNPYGNLANNNVPQFSYSPTVRRLKRLGILSVGLYSGCVTLILGFLAAFFFAVASFIGIAAGGMGNAEAGIGVIFVIIVVPLFYGVLGFLGGIVSAVVYNVVAGITGGIEMEFDS